MARQNLKKPDYVSRLFNLEHAGLFINAFDTLCQSFVHIMSSLVITVTRVVTVSMFEQIKTTPGLEAIMILREGAME